MKVRSLLVVLFFFPLFFGAISAQSVAPSVIGYRDFTAQAKVEARFLAVPEAALAGQHLKILTSEPHLAATPGDRKTAEYVAKKFRAAGLDTEIVPYRVLLNRPRKQLLEAWDSDGKVLLSGLSREHVKGDPFQNDPRASMPFHGSSASGDVTAEVVYANYGRLEDFDHLAAEHIDLRGKIVLCRYGANFRGVKVYIAEQRGAAGVLIYSDPHDDGYAKGDAYPLGPWRPESAVQMGSVQFLFKYPGDPETPGLASTPRLPDSARLRADKTGNQPHIPSLPISYDDAAPILQAMKGVAAPQSWQGALPFHYHLGLTAGPGAVKVHLYSDQDYQLRTIWDVIGRVKGAERPEEWVIAGNHRDAWIYGAVDPSSGTAAMLEAVHGVGALLKHGWRPKRTLLFASWDAEEEGLIGSTEWVEQHAKEMEHAVAYFNTDMAVGGPDFTAEAVPSLKQFLREVVRDVPSPLGGTVFQQWRVKSAGETAPGEEVRMGDLGSGSDYTPFFQHAGVPATDISSEGPYGVYHSVFDNYAWFTQNADPHFHYLQEMARVFGLEAVRMADADILPYDYVTYARQIEGYLAKARRKAEEAGLNKLDFAPAQAAAARFAAAAQQADGRQLAPTGNLSRMNQLDKLLRQTESDLLSEPGLPNRPWYRHTIYAPGEFTGYSAVAIPGVNEAIDAGDFRRAERQLSVLLQALERAANTLGEVR
jgi:N-acetylated-alpha-linked acidic dipeptidase